MNGFRKLMLGVAGTLLALVLTSVWYQMGGYASADDLETQTEKCDEREKVSTAANTDVKVTLKGIETALKILLKDYQEARTNGGG